MPKAIGNPLSWTASTLGSAFGHASAAARAAGASDEAVGVPEFRKLEVAHLRTALRKGWADVMAFRSDVVFACLLYPAVGAMLIAVALQDGMVHLLFPILSGFALVGPVAAVGLYEMSRRREAGLPTNWLAYLDVIRSPKFGGILILSLFHVVVFLVWIMVANMLFRMTLGAEWRGGIMDLLQVSLTTAPGFLLVVLGVGIGFLFAALVLAISVMSFPLMLDRDVSLPQAVIASIKVALANPVPVGLWGAIVAGGLAIGSLPALLGLVLVLPLLGHASWHLYRQAVV